jgi:hypothetical protein
MERRRRLAGGKGRVRRVFDAARWLDEWLQTHLGRPYNALLGAGLTVELINRLQHLPKVWTSGRDVAGNGLALALELALLIHQLGEFSERAERRHARKAAATGPEPD